MANEELDLELNPLITEQVALEEECLKAGAEAYMKAVAELAEEGNETRSRPVAKLMIQAVPTVAAAIETLRNTRRRGPAHVGLTLTRDIDAKVLAVHGLRECMNTLSTNRKVTGAAERIGTAVMEELNYLKWSKEQERLYKTTQTHIKHSTTGERKRAITRHMLKIANLQDLTSWDAPQRTHVGMFLIDCIISSTDLFTTTLAVRDSVTVRLLQASEATAAWLQDAYARSAQFMPLRVPMLCKPRDWTGPYGGGYLTSLGGVVPLVKTRNKAYLRSLDDVALDEVCAALNAIQSVPWRINEAVRAVAAQCWDAGLSIGSSLPNRDFEPLPAMPCEPSEVREYRKAHPEAYKAWARRAAAVHERNAHLVSKRQSAAEKLALAERFTGREAIYFPHNLDFRGRVYPIPNHLNPQGDDLARGLLCFAEAKPITERGIFWLKIHVANCFGVDKVSLEQRVAWVDNALDRLLDSGLQPMEGSRFWMEADDPFQALAACIELTGALMEGPGYLSRLSIPMDGSCNGLQNFSAMLRDPIGGKATNLVPQDKPADIYSEVARVVAERVRKDAEAGEALAILWDGRISRKIVKQPVMTLPYGATKNGMRGQIEEALRKNLPALFPKDQTWAACTYLANITYDAIGTVVVAARSAMDWLRSAAKLAASEEFPIRWTAPSGLPIMQDYRQGIEQVVKVHLDGESTRLVLLRESEKLDKKRQSYGISPNFVHSLDAAHLIGTTNVAFANGITAIALIHDSYGTHAAATDVLHACIREAFVQQYTVDVLAKFRDELVAQLPKNLVDKLPPLPEMGDLDLDLVRQSSYFFA